MPSLDLEVYGTPATQGSYRAFLNRRTGQPIVTQDSAATRPWRDNVRAVAIDARLPEGWAGKGPIWVELTFSLRRPASAPRSVTLPAKKPDVDKLARAVLDALTEAGVWADDAQVVDLRVRKVFAGSESLGAMPLPGVRVRVTTEDPDEPTSGLFRPEVLEQFMRSGSGAL